MPTDDATKIKAALQKVADWITQEYDTQDDDTTMDKTIRDHILAMIEGIDSIA
jgi:hypothetical protein